MGEVKYPAEFSHFDYVNPNAPKGGTARFGSQGTFDNFNLGRGRVQRRARGRDRAHLRHAHDPSFDEVGTVYGLVAESVRYPADYSSVTYTIRAEGAYDGSRSRSTT